MKPSVLTCYRRECRWAAAKRFMQDATYAAGAATLLVVILIAALEVDIFFEVVR